MAFRAPRPQQPLQRITPSRNLTSTTGTSFSAVLTSATEEEWVVFSPSSVGETAAARHDFHNSDFGSIISADNGVIIPGSFDEASELDTEEDDEASEGTFAETDSLQAFREQGTAGTVGLLPTHDGLGMFTSNTTMGGQRSLEESLRIVATTNALNNQMDTNSRIEKWRIEQSQAFLDEVERVTRKRRLTEASNAGNATATALAAAKAAEQKHEEDIVSLSARTNTTSSNATIAPTTEDTAQESFWKRITRSFIRDIIGIDDSLLEVIFGESLPAEALEEPTRQHRREVEARILDRIAKELGDLVHLYTSHTPVQRPSTSASHRQTLQEPRSPAPVLLPSQSASPRPRADSLTSASEIPHFAFKPTLEAAEKDSDALWGIEEEPAAEALLDAQLNREYWEQDLDMRLVYTFLKSKILGQTPVPPAMTTAAVAAPASPGTAHSVRYNHPLINKRSAPRRGCGSSRTSVSTKSKGYYWDVATSVASGKSSSCVQGVWAAI